VEEVESKRALERAANEAAAAEKEQNGDGPGGTERGVGTLETGAAPPPPSSKAPLGGKPSTPPGGKASKAAAAAAAAAAAEKERLEAEQISAPPPPPVHPRMLVALYGVQVRDSVLRVQPSCCF